MSGKTATSGEAGTDSSCKAEFPTVEGRRSVSASKEDPAEFRGSLSPASLREIYPHDPISSFQDPMPSNQHLYLNRQYCVRLGIQFLL